MDLSKSMLVTNFRLSLALMIVIAILYVLRKKIGMKMFLGASLFLTLLILLNFDYIIQLIISAVSGALISDQIKEYLKKEVEKSD